MKIGLTGIFVDDHDVKICSYPMGTIKIKFVGKNEFGVLDHDVTLPSGDKEN